MRTGVALLLLVVASACDLVDDARAGRRDVLLILIDTLRADRLGSYGGPAATSPNLDRLAAEGARFARVVASTSVTSPSVASILTGRYPRFNTFGFGNGGYRLAPEERTIAEHFRDAGYRTAAIISNPMLHERAGFEQGFELYDVEMRQSERVRGTPERTAGPATDAALRWLDGLADDESAFLWIHYMDPHGPYTPPDEFGARFAPADPGREIASAPRAGANSGRGFVPWYQAVTFPHRYAEYVGRYDAEIAYTDSEIGRLLAWLRDHGRYESAVVMVSSDHGEALGENGFYFAHGHAVTADQTSVPLILKHPDVEPGRIVQAPVGHVDIYDTLVAEVGGAPASDRFEASENLVAWARAGGSDRALISDLGQQIAIHRGDYMLLGSVDWDPGGRSGPQDFTPKRLARYRAEGWEPVRAPERVRELSEYARAYLSRAPAEAAPTETPPGFAELLRRLGYADVPELEATPSP